MSTTRELNQALTCTEQKSEDKRTPLEKHIDYFGGTNIGGDISYTSMVDRNKSIGESDFTAKTTAAKVSFLAGMSIKHCPFRHFTAKDAVGKLNHSHHTGMYNLDGTINEYIWSELSRCATVAANGAIILTQANFYAFLNARRKLENSWDLFGKLASDGEWSSYWQKFSSSNASDGVYVTLKELREFFEDTSKPGHEVEERVKNHK